MTHSHINLAGSSISIGHKKPSCSTGVASSGRGEVTGFSKRSRSNLMRELSRLAAPPSHFLTLNFPPGAPRDPQAVKAAIDKLGKRMVRAFPSAYAIWRVEFGGHDRPHIHIAGDFGGMLDDELTAWVFKAWREILGFADPNPRHIVEARFVLDSRREFAARYLCKPEDARKAWRYARKRGEMGRRWGIINRKAANFAPPESFAATETQVQRIKALLTNYLLGSDEATPGRYKSADTTKRFDRLLYKLENGYDVALHGLPYALVAEVKGILGVAA